MCIECLGKEPNLEMSSFFGLKVPGAFYSPGAFFEVMALVGPPSSNGLDQVDLDTLGNILTS